MKLSSFILISTATCLPFISESISDSTSISGQHVQIVDRTSDTNGKPFHTVQVKDFGNGARSTIEQTQTRQQLTPQQQAWVEWWNSQVSNEIED